MKKFGLDFGTTNSSLSVAEGDQVTIISIDDLGIDPRVVRSMLYFARREIIFDPHIPAERLRMQYFLPGEISYQGEQKYLIGQAAVNQYLNENKNRTAGIKRTIFTGRFIDTGSASEDQPRPDLVAEYTEETDYGTGRLLQALKSSLKTSYKGSYVFGKFYTVEELISIFLKQIKEKAEEVIGTKIERITSGRPVIFSVNPEIDQKAQDRLESAYKLAGFNQVYFQFEPVAAARQYLSHLTEKDGIILVFDFGGGTLDTALIELKGEQSRVLATDGIYIGGDLLNADIMQAKLWNYFGANTTWGDQKLPMPIYLYQSLNSWYSIPALNSPDTWDLLEKVKYKHSDPQTLVRLGHLIRANLGFELYEAIETAKKALSSQSESIVRFSDGPIEINQSITRQEFESIIQDRVDEIRQTVMRTLNQANLTSDQVTKVVRTGGSSLIPVFEHMLIDMFGKEKIVLFETFTSIAAGLARESTD